MKQPAAASAQAKTHKSSGGKKTMLEASSQP
jgi:hypothetical protein